MLVSKHIKHQYKEGRALEFPDISVKDKERLLLLGPSGCGKTTLLHILAGLLAPSSGEVLIGKQNIYNLSQQKLDVFRGQNIGMVFQKPHFIKALTVLENIQLAQFFGKKKDRLTNIQKLLKQLELENYANKKTTQLSEGEKQRLAIVRALANAPKVVFADEPTSALDDIRCNDAIQLLINTCNENKALLIVVTHDNRISQYFENKIILS